MKRLKRLLGAVDSLPFWIGVFIASVLFVFTYAYVNNRHTTAHNVLLLQRQQEQLSYLCETISVFDALTLQQLRIARETMARPDVPLWGQLYLAKREQVLGTTHEELSNSRGCRQIE